MLAFLRKASKVRSRAAEVGWLLDTEKAGFIWNAPQKLVPPDPTNRHAKSVRFCPAVLDHEAMRTRFFVLGSSSNRRCTSRLERRRGVPDSRLRPCQVAGAGADRPLLCSLFTG